MVCLSAWHISEQTFRVDSLNTYNQIVGDLKFPPSYKKTHTCGPDLCQA